MYSSNFMEVADYIGDLSDIYGSCCYAWMDEGIKVEIEDGCFIEGRDMEFFRSCYRDIDVIKDLYYKTV